MSLPDLGSLYQRLASAYKKAHADKPKQTIQNETNKLWSQLKSKSNVSEATEEEISGLLLSATKKKATLLQYFSSSAACNSKESVTIADKTPIANVANIEIQVKSWKSIKLFKFCYVS